MSCVTSVFLSQNKRHRKPHSWPCPLRSTWPQHPWNNKKIIIYIYIYRYSWITDVLGKKTIGVKRNNSIDLILALWLSCTLSDELQGRCDTTNEVARVLWGFFFLAQHRLVQLWQLQQAVVNNITLLFFLIFASSFFLCFLLLLQQFWMENKQTNTILTWLDKSFGFYVVYPTGKEPAENISEGGPFEKKTLELGRWLGKLFCFQGRPIRFWAAAWASW